MTDAELAQQMEALLFSLGRPLSRKELASLLKMDAAAVEQGIAALGKRQGGLSLVDDGSMVELRASASVAELIERTRKEEYARDIGKAGLEALAAILYRGPLTRSEIDFIRGVNSSQTLRTLTMRGLARRVPNPRDERSFLYESTTELLSTLGVERAADLPEYAGIRQKMTALEEAYRAANQGSGTSQ